MATIDWLWILHPALAVVVVYPLFGIVLRLAQQARSQRRRLRKAPATSGADHADVGRLLTGASLLITLVALAVVIATTMLSQAQTAGSAAQDAINRMGPLVLALFGVFAAFIALWRSRRPLFRALFAFLCWGGVLGIGLRPEVWRLSDDPMRAGFWQSHFWGGFGLIGLLLFAMAARPEIHRHANWRRLHVAANLITALLLVTQGITGTRDLLEIPLSWQKPAIDACNPSTRTCEPPSRALDAPEGEGIL